ncbi:MAG: peptidylprolyl isomerase [Acidimicrobiia bacterium]
MPAADKRARKKENARAAREQREAALKRKKRIRSATTFGIVAVLFIGVVVLISVAGGKSKKAASKTTTPTTKTTTTTAAALPAGCVATVPPKTTKPSYKAAPVFTIDRSKTYVAHVSTTCGTFDITLADKVAPLTVNSFVFLADHHFYDGLTFQRLVKNFVIQGGDPKGNGTGGPGYALPTEPPIAGYEQGSVAMANAGPGTTGSQFFVAVSPSGAKSLGGPPYLYSDLGTVTKNFDVVQKLMTFAGSGDGPPTRPLYMFSVTITES